MHLIDPSLRPRLLILGTGFLSFQLLKRINRRAFDVTIVSRRNHFLFTPLLPSTAVGTVEFRAIIESVRRSSAGATFLLGSAERVDPENRVVTCRGEDGTTTWLQPYDLLVIAVGSEVSTFGIPGVREHACVLKDLIDARIVRERIVAALEKASIPGLDEQERRRLLHFVAVGAGPTGVRFAAEVHDLLAADIARSYPHLARLIQITVVEAGPNMLGSYDKGLGGYAHSQFQRDGINVRFESPVAHVGPAGLRLQSGEEIRAGLILWAGGFAPTSFVASLPFTKDRRGRLLTDDCLRIVGYNDIFAGGDCARPESTDLPQLAQVAEQQGRYLAGALNRISLQQTPDPFHWKNLGVSSFIGRGRAVVEHPKKGRRYTGAWAYQLWRSAIFTHLASRRTKILVPLDRLRAYVFGRDLSKF